MSGEPKLLWEPSAERVQQATVTRYSDWLQRTRELEFDDYGALWEWSVQELEAFWASIVEFFELELSADTDALVGGSRRAIGWSPTCRTSPRPSPPSWPVPRSARCGHRRRPSSAPAA